MYADRIDIFHVADSDHISGAVTHNFVLDFFPSGYATLNKHFTDT